MADVQMNDDARLTIDDPIDEETMRAFHAAHDSQVQIALELLSLEQRRVQLLRADMEVQMSRGRLFQHVLVERGLPPDTAVDIDPETRKLTPLNRKG